MSDGHFSQAKRPVRLCGGCDYFASGNTSNGDSISITPYVKGSHGSVFEVTGWRGEVRVRCGGFGLIYVVYTSMNIRVGIISKVGKAEERTAIAVFQA